jgi:hypothetical protein
MGRFALRPVHTSHRLEARLRRYAFDERLAAGEDPGGDPKLRQHADELCRLDARLRVAAYLERALRQGMRPGRLSPAVAVSREALTDARPALQQLIAALRNPAPAQARGVAMAEQLLTDGCSPLYAAVEGETLEDAAHAARMALRALH